MTDYRFMYAYGNNPNSFNRDLQNVVGDRISAAYQNVGQSDTAYTGMDRYSELAAKFAADVAEIRKQLAAMAEDKSPAEPLVDQVEAVIKGVVAGKVPARKVEELHNVTGRAKQDGAVHRAVKG